MYKTCFGQFFNHRRFVRTTYKITNPNYWIIYYSIVTIQYILVHSVRQTCMVFNEDPGEQLGKLAVNWNPGLI